MTDRPISRIAIINRGEAAVRLIHAVAELNRETDHQLTTIALHTFAERRAMFARMAHETHLIASDRMNPYLDYEVLERALIATESDAAWVGWGFVAEHPEFVELCDRLGVTFIGPSADVMRSLGDKIGAKTLAETVGVPVAPWSGGSVDSVDDARRHAADIGFPLLIKATAGGGGRGIRRVDHEDELAGAFERASDEAEKSFGDRTVFMEHLVTGARHVEVQIAADGVGNAWALGVRDCSIQRRNQKVLEESSSPVLTSEQNEMLGRVAIELVVAANYQNVGTVEFLYEPKSQAFSFLEVNTRLQVEHPITELTTGVDLVKLQLQLASGLRLEGPPPAVNGHAIEARLNAEDPSSGFAPASGEVIALRFPSGPGVRVDTGISEGDRIQPEYDAMVAKVMAWGRDRGEARARLVHALEETVVAIEGGATNKSFLLHLLHRPEVVDGTADTAWLDRLTADGSHLVEDHAAVAVLVAGAEAYLEAAVYARTAFFATAARGRPRSTHEPVTTVDCRLRGEQYRLAIQRVSPDVYHFEVDGNLVSMSIDPVNEWESRVRVGGRTHRIMSVTQGGDHLIEVDHITHRVSRDDAGRIRSPSPSLVIAVNVAPGDSVRKGDTLVVLEAMKMETAITAPFDGVVVEVMTGPSIQVDAGAVLITIEAGGDEDDLPTPGNRIGFSTLVVDQPAEPVREQHLRLLEEIRWTVLGFDTQPGVVKSLAAQLLSAQQGGQSDDPEIIAARLRVLSAFSDVSSLARNRRVDQSGDEEAHNPKEFLHKYLRSLDIEAEGLPSSFRTKLERAFAHYGVDSLDHTLDLERAAFRLFNAQHESASHEPLLAAVLHGLRLDPNDLSPETSTAVLRTLDEFVPTTELRFPNLGSAARNVRYFTFEQPAAAARKRGVLDEMRRHLESMRSGDANPEHLRALVNCPEAVVELLADDGGSSERHDPILDVMFGRLYRVKTLHDVETSNMPASDLPASDRGIDGRSFIAAAYRTDGELRHVVATIADQSDAAEQLRLALSRGHSLPGDHPLSIDLYCRWDGSVTGFHAVGEWSKGIVDAADTPANIRRITFTGAAPNEGAFHYTYRPSPEPAGGTFVEDLTIRHCHPMIAARLQLDRFENFELFRLPSRTGVYSFKAVGLDNPRDTRLIAVAEVRDLTPSRDDDGTIVSLPATERAVSACASAIRTARVEHDPNQRLALNRIVLYVWPPFDLPIEALDTVAARLSSLTAGLGLEQVEVIGTLVENGVTREAVVRFGFDPGNGRRFEINEWSSEPIAVLDSYRQNIIASRQRGSIYPYELIDRLISDGGSFTEYALTDDNSFGPIERPKGSNQAGFVCGVINTPTDRHDHGMTRVLLLGDPTKGLASIAEAECRTVVGACDLADELDVPVEWYAVSAGARISMDTGTESMDWISIALRRIIEFTQNGGEMNIIVTGINVGAQPYFNAEATMLMHTKGILIMTPDSAMVLTGKQSLDYSGGVSAEDNFGLGGYDRIMGPNGQAQYWAPDLDAACEIMRRHNEHAHVLPGERFPRRAKTTDDPDRDVSTAIHDGDEFRTVGEVFSESTNPGRKKPFDIRSIMRAVIDADQEPMERWADMRDADTGVVFEAHLGGYPVMLLGISSRAIPRTGLLPADGPDQWTSGTLFPMSSKKIARAINSASGSRPVVVLANLSGFDGSPESLAKWQLEYGAEIGRAITNFDGPIVFCVVSRYHGGAFVVFSKVLNDNMEALAVEGTFASVLGGAPAAAVVFTREVDQRTDADPRIVELRATIAAAHGSEQAELRAELHELRISVRAEKLGEKAAEFDAVHTVQRARDQGSVDAIIPSARLRPELIASLERGIARTLDRT